MKNRGELRGAGLPGVDEFLNRRGYNEVGVIDAVFNGWNRFSRSEQCYAEVTNQSPSAMRRSDLTDDKSMKMYYSCFPEATVLSQLDVAYIRGQTKDEASVSISKRNPMPLLDDDNDDLVVRIDSAFKAKATMHGFALRSYDMKLDTSSPSLFSEMKQSHIPEGFEQINEDLYARKDNRFLVFNSPCLGVWPPNPVTKINCGITDDILIGKQHE